MARNHPNGTTPTDPPCCERSRMMRTNETEVLQAAAECDFDVAIVGYGPVGQALAAGPPNRSRACGWPHGSGST